MTHIAFAVYLDRDMRTVTRWASGKDKIPTYVWVTLDTLLEKSEDQRQDILDGLSKKLAAERKRRKAA